MRTSRTVCAGLLAAAVLAVAAMPAEACCVESSPTEQYDRADVVFFGRVVRQTHPPDKGGTESEFEVLRVLKGTTEAGFTLWETTGPAPGPEGMEGLSVALSTDVGYRLGESYIVFATKGEGGWGSSICSGTQTLSDLSEDALVEAGLGDLVKYLPGEEPAPGSASSDETARAASLWWAALLAGPMLVGAGVTMRRRTRR